ncbi:MAG TPA: hypothetical protein VD968_00525 [Pyrinomonadaceae bacterium]|nr:hypothetical protein [Pyrinomonadaceae bacterium]
MRPRHYALTIALALAAGLAGRALGDGLWAARVAEAREPARAEEERRWEYAAVTKAQFVGSPRGGTYWIAYFRGSGAQVFTVEAGVTESAQAKALSRMGDEGWEMVGEGPLEVRQSGPGGTPTAIFFKRRKE